MLSVRFYPEAAFDDTATSALGEAFDRARQDLLGGAGSPAKDNFLAHRIIEVARMGERDPEALSREAAYSLGILT
jgi:hypothetical protein